MTTMHAMGEHRTEEEKIKWITNLIDYYEYKATKIINSKEGRKFLQGRDLINNDMDYFFFAMESGDSGRKICPTEAAVHLLNDVGELKSLLNNKDFLMVGLFVSRITFWATTAGIQYLYWSNFGDVKAGDYNEYEVVSSAEKLMEMKEYENTNQLALDVTPALGLVKSNDIVQVSKILRKHDLPLKQIIK